MLRDIQSKAMLHMIRFTGLPLFTSIQFKIFDFFFRNLLTKCTTVALCVFLVSRFHCSAFLWFSSNTQQLSAVVSQSIVESSNKYTTISNGFKAQVHWPSHAQWKMSMMIALLIVLALSS